MNADDQRAGSEQGKTQTVTEFFREKFADEEESELDWIDPKGEAGSAGENGRATE
jgi:hypothetical protein